mmetsp:Transcript_21673/g.39183  ORF Transcript_21673/g.39183 Transcript_21673/m.39183 type:complete len:107 (+) Transcript_21673:863-1183(+)
MACRTQARMERDLAGPRVKDEVAEPESRGHEKDVPTVCPLVRIVARLHGRRRVESSADCVVSLHHGRLLTTALVEFGRSHGIAEFAVEDRARSTEVVFGGREGASS